MDAHERARMLREKDEAINRLLEKHKAMKCQACQQSAWEAGGVFLLTMYPGPEQGGVGSPPVLLVRCKSCGHILFFDAKQAGADQRP
jgi:RNase P subunit RPR2